MNESELIQRLKQHDKVAMRAFQSQFQSEIFRYLWRLTHDKETTQDLWIEVCVQVWQNIKDFVPRHSNSFEAWVRRVAHNLAVDEVRRHRNDVPTQPLLLEAEFPNPERASESDTDEGESIPARILQESLSALPARYQELLRLRATFCTPAQIAQITGDPSSRVGVKLNQAAKALLKQIRQHPQTAELAVELPTHTKLLNTLKALSNVSHKEDAVAEAKR